MYSLMSSYAWPVLMRDLCAVQLKCTNSDRVDNQLNGCELTTLFGCQTMLVGGCGFDVLAGRSDVRREAISMGQCAGKVTMVREQYEGRRAQREKAEIDRGLGRLPCRNATFWSILASRELGMPSGSSTIPADGLITFSRGFRFGGAVALSQIREGEIVVPAFPCS